MTKIYEEAKDQHVAYVVVYGLLDSDTTGTLYVDEAHAIPLTVEQAADLFEHSKMKIHYDKPDAVGAGTTPCDSMALMRIDGDLYVTLGATNVQIHWKAGVSI